MSQSRFGRERVETTIGDLIVALTQIVQEQSHSDEETYAVTSVALGDILRRHSISWPENSAKK